MTTSSARQATPRIATDVVAAQPLSVLPAQSAASGAMMRHWQEYLMEAAGLGAFMISACAFALLFEFPGSPVRQAVSSDVLRRFLMGLAMGLTAVAIIYSPWGKQSGAHINPIITLTFWRLGKIKTRDAAGYVLAQFLGAMAAVYLVALMVGDALAHPAVRFAVTVPGEPGIWSALGAEFLISFGMMSLVLYCSNHHQLGSFTGLFAGALVAVYITFEAPLSGMSMNPARTMGSAFSAGIWDALWIYFAAPLGGMLLAAEIYLWGNGKDAVKCGKLHHNNNKRCIFCGANGAQA